MAPERRPLRENAFPFEVGVRGRKTGLTLPDTGIRDENGLEPMDHLFSSPEKPQSVATKKSKGPHKNLDTTISSEEDMDVGESTIPEPVAVLTERASMRLPPRSKSPIKTFLKSPARRNPSLGPVSSPTRGSIVEPKTVTTTASVRRKLDFSNASFESNESSATTNPPQKRGVSATMAKSAKPTNGERVRHLEPAFSSDDGINNGGDEDMTQDDVGFVNGESSYQEDNGIDDVEPEALIEEIEDFSEPEEEPQLPKKSKGKGKEVEVTKPAGRKGRPPKKIDLPVVEEDEEPRPKKRTRQSLDAPLPAKKKTGRSKKVIEPVEQEVDEEQAEEQVEEERPAKRSRRSLDGSESSTIGIKEKTAATKSTKPKGRGKAKLSTIQETDSPAAQRGPPMPRTNRGLVSLRKETPMENSGFTHTRSGRLSCKPLATWMGEQIEYTDDVMEDAAGRFVVRTVKSITRAEPVEQKAQNRPRSKSKAPKSRKRKQTAEPESESEEDDEVEPWEADPGRIIGEVRSWDPDDQLGSTTEEKEEEIALSSAAIITRDIAGATFRFAKTLTLPFFGAGMVDLPPGSVKKQKNSRKMQMAFFVFYGRVQVMVNDNVFRIGKGGMWQVPRGNFYSIENDYDKPARIFFSQGCEVVEEVSVSES